MMGYINLKKDLPERTKIILNEYEGKYEVTLLINCLLALLILPREKCFEDIPDENIEDLKGWGLTKENIKKVNCKCCGHKLKEIVRNMRNATAHINIETDSDSENKINKIIFKNRNILIETNPEDLGTFVKQLANFVTDKEK